VSFLWRRRIGRARTDLIAFAGMALVDEKTGKPVGKLTRGQKNMLTRWAREQRTVSLAPSGTGKSFLGAVYIAWRLGNDPSLRVALLSGTLAQAQKLMRLVVIVLQGAAFQAVFPGIKIERSTLDELSITGRPTTQKDANVIAAAYDLSSMLGSRLDLAFCDDVTSLDSVRTPAARDAAYQAFLMVTSSRVEVGGSIHVVNTATHSDDLPTRLGNLPDWTLERYPAADEHGNPTIPARWPVEAIEAKRRLGSIVYARDVLCVPIDASTLVFSEEAIALALKNGQTAHISPVGGRVVIGVDPAWTVNAGSDLSGIVMCVIDSAGYRHLTFVEGGKWNPDQLADRVVALARANNATVYVESNGAGGVIAHNIGKRAPCVPLPTGSTNRLARIEALNAELSSGRWAFSCPLGYPGPELKKLVDDLSVFNLESHTGDRLSALFLALDGIRSLESKPKGRVFPWRKKP
jgi:phage terminase large subunit-like protein